MRQQYFVEGMAFTGMKTQNIEQRKAKLDKKLRLQLIEKIKGIGLPFVQEDEMPLVSLEDFFQGNDDLGSIGCNLPQHPGIDFFYERLKWVRGKPKVQDVLIGISEVEESDPTMWPFSDHVWVIADTSLHEVEDWLKDLEADEVEEGPGLMKPLNLPDLSPGNKLFTAFWD